jgi:CDP-diacylglycerol--glycerol-3-phosphate 3-phosphatidyltransferase
MVAKTSRLISNNLCSEIYSLYCRKTDSEINNLATTERFWTIPNILSLYRIVIFPFILYLLVTKNESLFALFITISLLTDILDGLIARIFRMQTKLGARLDSWADTGTYILAFTAIYLFRWKEIKNEWAILSVFFITWIISYAVVFIKFKGLIGLHTYLSKITGYLQGAFIVVLFLFGYNVWLFYLCLGVGIIACTEEIIIIVTIAQPMSNVKGLYWILKNKRG